MKYLIKLNDGQEITKEAAKIQVGFTGIRGFNEQGSPVFHYSNVSSWEVVEDTPGQTTRTEDKSCCNHGKEPPTIQDVLERIQEDMALEQARREAEEFLELAGVWRVTVNTNKPEKELPPIPPGIPGPKEGWTYVGEGNPKNASLDSSPFINMYARGWDYAGESEGCLSGRHYAVKNDAPDEIWQRFGFTCNPVLLQAAHGAFKHDPDAEDHLVFCKWYRDVQREIKGDDLRITRATRHSNKLPDGNRCMAYTVTMETTDGKHRSTGETFHKYPWEIRDTRVLDNIRAHLETTAELVRLKVKKEAEEARRKAEEERKRIHVYSVTFSGGSTAILYACDVREGLVTLGSQFVNGFAGYGPDGSRVFLVRNVVSHQCIGYLDNPAEGILDNQVVSTGSDEVQGVATTFRAHLEVSEDGRIGWLRTELH